MSNERICPEQLEWINRAFCTSYDDDRLFLIISGENPSDRGFHIANVIDLNIVNDTENVTAVFFILGNNLIILFNL